MKRTPPKVKCARCDIRLADPSRRIYSKWTHNHYCFDMAACARREAKRASRTLAT